ncbi:hypothetical protein [Simplicispira piscis]|jgi:hypothetical protein
MPTPQRATNYNGQETSQRCANSKTNGKNEGDSSRETNNYTGFASDNFTPSTPKSSAKNNGKKE